MKQKRNVCVMRSRSYLSYGLRLRGFKGYRPGRQDGTDILFGQLKLVKIKVSQNRPMVTLSHTLAMLTLQDATTIDCQ